MRLQLIQQYRYTAVLLLFLFRIIMFKIARLFVYESSAQESSIQWQVCVQPPTPADNVTLLAFAVERRAAVCRAAAGPRLIDISCPPANPQQQRRAAARKGRTDRRTDSRTDGRTDARQLHRPCSAYAGNTNKRASVSGLIALLVLWIFH